MNGVNSVACRTRSLTRAVVCVSFTLTCPEVAESGRQPHGVVVEGVDNGSACKRAGIEAGDQIFGWRRQVPGSTPVAHGHVESPFDLVTVEIEQSPRGPVTLVGAHGGRRTGWLIPPGTWGLDARPPLTGNLLRLYLRGKELVDSAQVEEGIRLWRTVVAESKTATSAWLLLKAAKELVQSKNSSEADAAYGQAVEIAKQGGWPAAAAQLLRAWGDTLQERSEWDRAVDCYEGAIALDTGRLGPESLPVALGLDMQGLLARKRGDLKIAEDFHRGALSIREKHAPGSLAVATSLFRLGAVLGLRRADLAAAEEYFRRSLLIRESLAPGTTEVSRSLIGLGLVALDRGDYAAAEEHLRRALGIQETIAAGSHDVAITLHNLSVVALDRGDVAAADDFLRRALAIKERIAPESLSVAGTLHGLGDVALNRGDLAAAEYHHRRALAIRERLASESLDVTWSLTGLGDVALNRGDLGAAEEYLRRALAIREKVAPESLDVSGSLNGLAEVALRRGDLAMAEEFDRRALAIQEKLAPRSLDLARSLTGLGEIAARRRDSAAAQRHEGALAIRERLAPGSVLHAESLQALGALHRGVFKPETAAEFLCRAIDALEQQRGRLGGTQEMRSVFAAKYANYYRDCAEVLSELGQSHQAFHVLERSRARSLLEMLAERDLAFSEDLPRDLSRERKLTNAEYDRTQAALSELKPGEDDQQIERQLTRLHELRERQREIASRIRQASPRYASLQYPEPLDLAGVRRALDSGTILLAYSVGKEKTLLFVVQPSGASSGLTILPIPVTAQALREKVEAFRAVVGRRDPADRDVLEQRGSELYDLLVRPVESLITPAERILVSPDGPLHTLPFAPLVRKEPKRKKGQKAPQYLVEWKPLHVVVSATVYAELKKTRREGPASAAVLLEAFGDPKYPPLSKEQAEEIANPELRSIVSRGFTPTPLPGTRQEVEAIAGLYPGQAQAHLGEEATEERAKAVGRDVRYVHFACHGRLNERFPLDSALILTIPERLGEGQDNGLLQAWEIFEKVRLDADLVTLSACETALGKEMGGEGLVGLTRAFQYAGARSVLASLWSVADQSSAALMKHFYGYLRAGKSKDEALRMAQVDQIKGEAPHPFHWAAFQIIGDWR